MKINNVRILEVTQVRPVEFVRDGITHHKQSYNYLVQWNIYTEQGTAISHEMVVEKLYDPDRCPEYGVGKLDDSVAFDINVSFHANRSKEGRVFNSIRLETFYPHQDYGSAH